MTSHRCAGGRWVAGKIVDCPDKVHAKRVKTQPVRWGEGAKPK